VISPAFRDQSSEGPPDRLCGYHRRDADLRMAAVPNLLSGSRERLCDRP